MVIVIVSRAASNYPNAFLPHKNYSYPRTFVYIFEARLPKDVFITSQRSLAALGFYLRYSLHRWKSLTFYVEKSNWRLGLCLQLIA